MFFLSGKKKWVLMKSSVMRNLVCFLVNSAGGLHLSSHQTSLMSCRQNEECSTRNLYQGPGASWKSTFSNTVTSALESGTRPLFSLPGVPTSIFSSLKGFVLRRLKRKRRSSWIWKSHLGSFPFGALPLFCIVPRPNFFVLVEVILKDYSGLEYRLGVEFEAAIDQVNYQIDKDLEDSCDYGGPEGP